MRYSFWLALHAHINGLNSNIIGIICAVYMDLCMRKISMTSNLFPVIKATFMGFYRFTECRFYLKPIKIFQRIDGI